MPAHNPSQLRRLVLNGPDMWPGANYVESSPIGTGNKRSLKFGDRRRVASELKVALPIYSLCTPCTLPVHSL